MMDNPFSGEGDLSPDALDFFYKVFGVSKQRVKSKYRKWMRQTRGEMTAKDLADVLQGSLPPEERHATQDMADLVLQLMDYLTASTFHGHRKADPEKLTFQDWMVLNAVLKKKGGIKKTTVADALCWCTQFKGDEEELLHDSDGSWSSDQDED